MKRQLIWTIAFALFAVFSTIEAWQLRGENERLRQKLDAITNQAKPPVTKQTPAERELGIIESREAFPIITTDMIVWNRWQGLSEGGELLIVFAGSEAADKNQGLVVYARLMANSSVPAEVLRIPTPARAGPVHIEGETDGLVTLTTKNGKEFVFNVRELRF